MSPPLVKLERDGHVAIVSFNRPEKLNAWAWGPTNELCAIADQLRFDTSVRVVVLRGEGRAFCAGEDLKPDTDDVEERHPGRSAAERTHVAYERAMYLFERWKVVDQLPQPVIAAIHGYCLGAGLELAMLADIRIAATDAVFALPQVTLGTQIVGGADLRMVSELGAARTKWLAMTGRRFGPDEAERWGLVQQVVAPDELLSTALAVAREIAANAPLAVQGVKRAVNHVAYRGFDEAARFEAFSSSVLWSSEDVYAGFAAKAKKQQAMFEGK
ncbi:MAG TPA: enoyl-CoA hydratase/isomerase family protein [Acidimicrobiales bacterium]|jgi:enoyl-CoA hydratase|nr:enoyl-CoA hydratase/isomerase family protein [Acidimicrobiales bacterium]